MRSTWQPTAKDEHYRLTGEATWDCTACCLDGHEAKAHDGQLNYAWGFDLHVTILRADPCLLLGADHLEEITHGTHIPSPSLPAFGIVDGDLLRIKASNQQLVYRLTKQRFNDRPSACTPAVAEFFPPHGDFYLAEWPD